MGKLLAIACMMLGCSVFSASQAAQGSTSAQSSDASSIYDEALERGKVAQLEADIAVAEARAAQLRASISQHQAYADYMNKRYEADLALRNTQFKLYDNQLRMELFIFGLVSIIVLAALSLAIAQFAVWAKHTKDGNLVEASAFTANKDGVVLNTPFVGLLMLLGAFAFFYLYISSVYVISDRATSVENRIKENSPAAQAPANQASPPSAQGGTAAQQPVSPSK